MSAASAMNSSRLHVRRLNFSSMRGSLEFDPIAHVYTLDGLAVPSVTQVLEAAGLSKAGQFAKDHHRTRGHLVHEGALLIHRGEWEPETTSPELRGYLYAYEKFIRDSGFAPQHSELPVCSRRFNVAGTLDHWGGGTLIDLKTGAPEDAVDIQTALYAYLLKESHGLETERRWAVWLQPNGEPRIYKRDEQHQYGADLQVGLAAVNLWWWRYNHKQLERTQ